MKSTDIWTEFSVINYEKKEFRVKKYFCFYSSHKKGTVIQ